ncbi:Putative S-adenosyl-L-methionine-dependent methyltransferase [Anaerolineae bacterium]|nr:Putative S-adenosyl-L-methionine-dependent methyltransferase [Anaerolineae bacterium]
MDAHRASITALITAYFRAYHATHDSPRIFDDFLADRLFAADEHMTYDQNLAGLLKLINPERAAANPDQATALACVMQTYSGPITLSRSRYTEDRLAGLIDRGVRQDVILGAGLDTVAFRRTDLLDRLHVFEVDHPATQALKHQRLAALGRPYPSQLHFVPIDFLTQRLSTVLHASAYDPQALTFFSWLGVTYYLSREAIFDTLCDVAALAPAGSSILFDYMDADAFIPERAARRIQLMQTIAGQVGEPMQTGFDPSTLAADLQQAGLRLEEDLGPAEIDARYFRGRTDEYHAFEHAHFARAVVA